MSLPHKNLDQTPGLRDEFGSTNREKSFGSKEIRIGFGKGKQVGEIVELECLN